MARRADKLASDLATARADLASLRAQLTREDVDENLAHWTSNASRIVGERVGGLGGVVALAARGEGNYMPQAIIDAVVAHVLASEDFGDALRETAEGELGELLTRAERDKQSARLEKKVRALEADVEREQVRREEAELEERLAALRQRAKAKT
jgi:hypothetical protein